VSGLDERQELLMVKNNIKSFRVKHGMTQRGLAKAADTSQQQVQRIEAGVQNVRLDLAERLASALHCSVRDLFPELRKALSKKSRAGVADEELVLADAGLELGDTLHRFVGRLQGAHDFEFAVSPRTAARIRSNIFSQHRSGFLVFDSSIERVALNYKALIYCNFLFDPFMEDDSKADPEREEEGVKVWLIEGGEPLSFAVDHDNQEEDDEELGQLAGIFYDLETRDEEGQPLFFVDEDGEEVVLAPAHLAMCAVPLEFVCKSLLDAQTDGWVEDEEGGEEAIILDD
jgi:transcriptional regulator with XRE-family HTH domain